MNDINILNKKIILFMTLSLASFALARETEVKYPMEGPTTTEVGIGGYISYIFNISIFIAGLIAFVVLIYGGFKYLTSGGNPKIINSAKKQMFAAIIGLTLLLGSYLILKTINPDLLNFGGEISKPAQGICFYNTNRRWCFSESQKTVPDNFEANSIEFISNVGDLPRVYIFNQEGWKGGATKVENKAGTSPTKKDLGSTLEAPASFFIDWNRAGIYLFKNTNLNPDFPNQPYRIYQSSAGSLGGYDNRTSSILIRNLGCTMLPGPQNYFVPEVKYGAILYSEPNFKGECAILFGNPFKAVSLYDFCTERKVDSLSSGSVNYIHPIGNNNLSSFKLFNHAFFGHSEGGVTFYDQLNYGGESFERTGEAIGEFWKDGTFNQLSKILSFKINGNFMVVLTKGSGFSSKCEVFTESQTNLKEDYIFEGEKNYKISSIAIIPLIKERASPQ